MPNRLPWGPSAEAGSRAFSSFGWDESLRLAGLAPPPGWAAELPEPEAPQPMQSGPPPLPAGCISKHFLSNPALAAQVPLTDYTVPWGPRTLSAGTRWQTGTCPITSQGAPTHSQSHQAQSSPALLDRQLFR